MAIQIKSLPILKEFEGLTIQEAIDFSKSLHIDYPKRIIKPALTNEHSADEAEAYAISLKQYEKNKVHYDSDYGYVKIYNSEVDRVLEAYLKEESGLNTIPEIYREKVWSRAWSDCHSGGYSEIFNKLTDLIEIFQ